MMKRALRSSLAILLLTPAAAAAETTTVDPSAGGACARGGTCATISSAVGASAPGDTVRVLGGTYNETVEVGVADLTVDGDGPVLVSGAGIDASAGGLTLRDVSVLSSGTALNVSAGTNRVQRSTLVGAASGLHLQAAELSVESSIVLAGAEGVAHLVTTSTNSPDAALTLDHVTTTGAGEAVRLDGDGSSLPLPGDITFLARASIIHGPSSASASPLPVLGNSVQASYENSDATEMTGVDAPGDGQVTPDGELFGDRLRLKLGSPAIDQGGAARPGESATDIDGDPRTAGSATDIGADEFVNHAPELTGDVSPSTVKTGEVVTAAANARDQEGASDIAAYGIDWGDGKRDSGPAGGFQHVYDAAGTFEVKIVAVDRSGEFSNVVTRTVTVTDGSAPQVLVTRPKEGSTALKGRKRQLMKVRGVFADPSGAEIELAITRRTGGCRHYDGRRFVRGRCKEPVLVPATVKGFRFRLNTRTMRFKPGRYQLRVRATDGAGNATQDFRKADNTLVAFRVG